MPSKWSLLCSSPRIFTKLLKPPFSYLRLQEVAIAWFVDTFVTLGRSFVKFEKISNFNVTLIDSLGFVVHQDKSRFVRNRLMIPNQ